MTFRFKVSDFTRFFILATVPIVFLLLADFSSFLFGWNVGRGGLVLALVFLIIDRMGFLPSRKTSRLSGKLAYVAVVLTTAYYGLSVFGSLQLVIRSWGEQLKIGLVYSWVWVWDYLVFAVYVTALVVVFYGSAGLRYLSSAVIYLSGVTVILLLDAVFPYDTLGPMQLVVPFILQSDKFLIELFKVGSASATSNTLRLVGNHGSFTFTVYWPSAGVHGVIIYSLIMLSFLLKIRAAKSRQVAYFLLGVGGTFTVNVLRIFLLSIYVLLVSTDPKAFEDFHAIAGELVFLPWISLYILAVSWVESKTVRKTS